MGGWWSIRENKVVIICGKWYDESEMVGDFCITCYCSVVEDEELDDNIE